LRPFWNYPNVCQCRDERLTERSGFIASSRGPLRLGVITNNGPEVRRWLQDQFDLADLVDVVVISGEEGIAKPDARVYRIAAQRLGVSVNECVFVDDRPDNVDGATAAGMLGLLHADPTTTVRELRALLDTTR